MQRSVEPLPPAPTTTTTTEPRRPETVSTNRIAAYDPDGHFLATVTPGYVSRALAAGEVARIPNGVALRPSAIVKHSAPPLSAEVKRRIFLAKQKARR